MKSDVAQQHLLLKLAGVDAERVRLAHRAAHLPEQQAYDQVLAEERAATDRLGVLAVALDDVEAEVTRMEAEVDAVRRREDRDRSLLDSGTVNPKQLKELQHELETLERRQADLEDIPLGVMERREEIAGNHAAQRTAAEALGRDVEVARQARARRPRGSTRPVPSRTSAGPSWPLNSTPTCSPCTTGSGCRAESVPACCRPAGAGPAGSNSTA